jgi:hypothetical protein
MKLAEKIWRGEYIELDELLPARLGAPGPTVLDVLLHSDKAKPKKNISTIEDWVLSFNTFISVVAMRTPEQVRDLLAYSSTIVKASQDFQGSPWLEYDVHFRKQIATAQWATLDASLWTMYFARASPKPATTTSAKFGASGTSNEHKSDKPRYTPYTSTRVCFRWNSRVGCHLVNCKYLHCCIRCRDSSHIALDCPQQRSNPPPSHPQEQPPRETSFRPLMGRR